MWGNELSIEFGHTMAVVRNDPIATDLFEPMYENDLQDLIHSSYSSDNSSNSDQCWEKLQLSPTDQNIQRSSSARVS